MIEIENILDVEKHLDGIDVVIFDLDDTLYSEKDYVKSGYRAISNAYPNVDSCFHKLWSAFLNKKPAIDTVLFDVGMMNEKERWLSIYRNHAPEICLYPGVKDLLLRLKKTKKLGIITDGRVEGQKAKISALKLDDLFDRIVITDEVGGIGFRKPNVEPFIFLNRFFKCDFSKMCYVGDNLQKDGIAPEKLGMRFIHFKNKDGLYQ